MSMVFRSYFNSPIGLLEIVTSEEAIQRVHFVEERKSINTKVPEIMHRAKNALDGYFKGQVKDFYLEYDLEDYSDFSTEVLRKITEIPYGHTTSYEEIATKVGNPKSQRGVGQVLSKNPILIFIPCHRVITQKGKLSGYAGGLEKKQWLLEHEAFFEKGIQKLPFQISRRKKSEGNN